MSLRIFAAVLLLGAATAQAATVTSLKVTCIDRSETTNDDIFLAATVEGKPVSWDKTFQEGTSEAHTIGMNDGGSFSLDAKSLELLKFTKSVQIVVNEKDVTSNTAL